MPNPDDRRGAVMAHTVDLRSRVVELADELRELTERLREELKRGDDDADQR